MANLTAEQRRQRLAEARSKLNEAEKALQKAEQEFGRVAREAHYSACRYFNGMDRTCTCGVDP